MKMGRALSQSLADGDLLEALEPLTADHSTGATSTDSMDVERLPPMPHTTHEAGATLSAGTAGTHMHMAHGLPVTV